MSHKMTLLPNYPKLYCHYGALQILRLAMLAANVVPKQASVASLAAFNTHPISG